MRSMPSWSGAIATIRPGRSPAEQSALIGQLLHDRELVGTLIVARPRSE